MLHDTHNTFPRRFVGKFSDWSKSRIVCWDCYLLDCTSWIEPLGIWKRFDLAFCNVGSPLLRMLCMRFALSTEFNNILNSPSWSIKAYKQVQKMTFRAPALSQRDYRLCVWLVYFRVSWKPKKFAFIYISLQNNLALKRAYISRNSLSFKKAKMCLLSQHQSN